MTRLRFFLFCLLCCRLLHLHAAYGAGYIGDDRHSPSRTTRWAIALCQTSRTRGCVSGAQSTYKFLSSGVVRFRERIEWVIVRLEKNVPYKRAIALNTIGQNAQRPLRDGHDDRQILDRVKGKMEEMRSAYGFIVQPSRETAS